MMKIYVYYCINNSDLTYSFPIPKFQMKLRRKRMESTRKDEKEIMCDYGPL